MSYEKIQSYHTSNDGEIVYDVSSNAVREKDIIDNPLDVIRQLELALEDRIEDSHKQLRSMIDLAFVITLAFIGICTYYIIH